MNVTLGLIFVASHRPTVSLDVISLVTSSCVYYRGQRATRCAIIHGALGDLERACDT
jgi:hypothetical protein